MMWSCTESSALIFLRWDDSFAKAIGMSHRTYQRHTSTSVKQLNPEQSGRTWKLAEILTKAVSIFGSKEEALAQSRLALTK